MNVNIKQVVTAHKSANKRRYYDVKLHTAQISITST